MKKLMAIALVGALSAPLSARAVIDPYLGMSVGQGNAHFTGGLDGNSYTSLGAQAGIKFPFVRGEVEYNRLFQGDISAGVGFINFYLEPFMFIPVISPYIGGGVGRLFDAKIGDAKLNSNSAFQGMLGTGITFPGFPMRFDAELRGAFTGNLTPNDSEVVTKSVYMGLFEIRVKGAYVF
ncbi:MAG: hypothetical protein LBH81_03270 [Rickettsiales bacterium]|jgi:hypothetical protein|nr:hypothetical protein [Rickettsiales bacterium]